MDHDEVKLREARDFLSALESGQLHNGAPFAGRTNAKIADLKRQIAMYERIIEVEQQRALPKV